MGTGYNEVQGRGEGKLGRWGGVVKMSVTSSPPADLPAEYSARPSTRGS